MKESRSMQIWPLLCLLLAISGCSISTLGALSQEQWSYNYALMEGATATHPEMIDGNVQTAGEAQKLKAPERVAVSPPEAQVLVRLPPLRHP